MFPVGHIAYTWGAANVLQRHMPDWADIDYRWLALAAMLPDIIDKPLALTVFRESQTSQGLGHTLILHATVALVAMALWRGRALPYVLAFNGHLVLDQIWHHPETLFFPFMGLQFDPYLFMGTPKAMVSVYRDIFLLPHIWMTEAIGLLVLGFFAGYYQLYRWTNLRHFLSTGRFGADVRPNTKTPEVVSQSSEKVMGRGRGNT